jgi:uncharacterized alkaline shock family protein YloU
MSDVAAGVPTPRHDSDYDPDQTDVALTPVEPAAPSYTHPETGFRGAVNDAGERVSSFASDAGEKVSAFASDAADKAGDYAERAYEAGGRIASQVVDRLRNNAELPSDRGSTTIADEVVEKIAGFAAREVEGVYDLGGDVARIFASVKERIGLGDADDQTDRGVKVTLDGKTAAIRITIVIEYGYVVYSVTEQIRAKVIDSVERLLGLDVTAVDINVDDVHLDEARLAATAKAPAQAS